MSSRIFLSYATENRELVDKYVAEFQRHGVQVWIDHQEIQHGDSLVARLNEAVSECSAAIVFFSEEYRRKPWTSEEQRMLLYEFIESDVIDRRLFVIRLDDTALPPMLGHRVWRNSDDPIAIARSIANRIAEDPSGIAEQPSRIDEIPRNMDGAALEQLATQIVDPLSQMLESTVPPRLPAYVKGYGKVTAECMPRPASDGILDDMKACLYCCKAHRRHIGSHQRSLAKQGLGIFNEAFRMALDEEIEKLDKSRFGDSSNPGLREHLDGLILAVYDR